MRIIFLIIIITIWNNVSGQSVDLIRIYDGSSYIIIDTTYSINNGKGTKFIFVHKQSYPRNTAFFTKPISIKQSSIDSFYLKNIFFQNLAIRNSKFYSNVIFESSSMDTFSIDSSVFIGRVAISKEPYNYVFFNSVAFKSDFIVRGISSEKIKMRNTLFLKSFIIDNTKLKAVSLIHCYFLNEVKLTGEELTGLISFDSCSLNRTLRLVNIGRSNQLAFSFNNTLLPDTIDLSGSASIANVIDFTKADYNRIITTGKKCNLYLYGTDISKIRIDYNYFKLLFTDPKSGKEISNYEKEKIYLQLLDNFRASYSINSYELLNKEYKRYINGCLWWVYEWSWKFIIPTLLSITSLFLSLWIRYRQNKANDRKNFEDNFYLFLKIQRDNVAEMKNSKGEGRNVFVSMKYEFEKIYEIIDSISDDDYKNIGIEKMTPEQKIKTAYTILFFGIGDNSNRQVKNNLKIDYDRLHGHITWLLDNKRDQTDFLFDGHQIRLGHYFRHLFQTVTFVHDTPLLNDKERKFYLKRLRAQLSTFELAILFLNTFSNMGAIWKNYIRVNEKNAVDLISTYELIRNIPSGFITDIDHKSYFPNIKYEGD